MQGSAAKSASGPLRRMGHLLPRTVWAVAAMAFMAIHAAAVAGSGRHAPEVSMAFLAASPLLATIACLYRAARDAPSYVRVVFAGQNLPRARSTKRVDGHVARKIYSAG
jgi:hypothetical protein